MRVYLRLVGYAIASLLVISPLAAEAQMAKNPSAKSITIGGYLGKRIDDCIEQRVLGQDYDHLVEPFRHQNETHRWQSEFWGKWVQGAISTYDYNHDERLLEMIRHSVDEMLATQLPNGYIGNYAEASQLQQWDIWGRKYTALGLLKWYDLTGDKRALEATERLIDHLMTQVGKEQGKRSIVSTGNYHGMASASILEPVVYLYQRTNKERYLEFARYIAEELNSPQGPLLVDNALADKPVSKRFPHPTHWFSRENGQKAYEMMSCYEGLLEMYKLEGKSEYLEAVMHTLKSILDQEINIAGSGSAFECWYGGKERQTLPTYHTMETCVTFTWMQFCDRILRLTGDVKLADELEKTIYNALLASMKEDGSQISKYSPLEGYRTPGEEQCGMHINCCNANGPRAFALIPQIIYHTDKENCALNINLYNDSKATLMVNAEGKKKPIEVEVTQNTTYPAGGTIEIELNPERSALFALRLRIPSWCDPAKVKLSLNGEQQSVETTGWYTLRREWSAGDKLSLELDMRGRLVELGNHQAILRGPIVLARDSRLGDGWVDETSVIAHKDGYVELTPTESPDWAFMTFTAPMVMGTDLEGGRAPKPIKLCDFASAGNNWLRSVRYRVWLPKTLNVQKGEYIPYNLD